MARGEIVPGIMEDRFLTHMTPSLARCTYYTLDTTLRGVCVPLIAPNHLGRGFKRRPTCSRVHTQAPGPASAF